MLEQLLGHPTHAQTRRRKHRLRVHLEAAVRIRLAVRADVPPHVGVRVAELVKEPGRGSLRHEPPRIAE